MPATSLAGIIALVKGGTVSHQVAKKVFIEVAARGGDPRTEDEALGVKQVADTGVMAQWVEEVVVSASGRSRAIQGWGDQAHGLFLVGQVMKTSKGKARSQGGPETPRRKALAKMKTAALGALLLLGACGGTPKVFVASHATGDRPTFEIEGGKARHVDIVSCGDTTNILWQADAPGGGSLPPVVVDSTKVLAEGCDLVRIIPGADRHFEVMPDRVAVQEL